MQSFFSHWHIRSTARVFIFLSDIKFTLNLAEPSSHESFNVLLINTGIYWGYSFRGITFNPFEIWANSLIFVGRFGFRCPCVGFTRQTENCDREELAWLVVPHQAVCLNLHGHTLWGRLVGPDFRATAPVSLGGRGAVARLSVFKSLQWFQCTGASEHHWAILLLPLYCSLLPAGPAMHILWELCRWELLAGILQRFSHHPSGELGPLLPPVPFPILPARHLERLFGVESMKERKIWGITIINNVKVLENFISQIRMYRMSILIIALRLTYASGNGTQPIASDVFYCFFMSHPQFMPPCLPVGDPHGEIRPAFLCSAPMLWDPCHLLFLTA